MARLEPPKPGYCHAVITDSHPRGFSGPHLPPSRRCSFKATVIDDYNGALYCRRHGRIKAILPRPI